MKTWLVKDARAHLGDVVSGALAGEPQRISRRGKDAVVVVSEAEWERSRAARSGMSFGESLAQFPLTHEEWLEVAPGPIPMRSRSRREPDQERVRHRYRRDLSNVPSVERRRPGR